MKTFLLNGCSFTELWEPSKKFISSLGCDKVVKISKVATSFQRTCRSTIEWIAQNGKPDMVIMPVSHFNRFDLPIAKKFDPLHNLHHKYWFDSPYGRTHRTRQTLCEVDYIPGLFRIQQDQTPYI